MDEELTLIVTSALLFMDNAAALVGLERPAVPLALASTEMRIIRSVYDALEIWPHIGTGRSDGKTEHVGVDSMAWIG